MTAAGRRTPAGGSSAYDHTDSRITTGTPITSPTAPAASKSAQEKRRYGDGHHSSDMNTSSTDDGTGIDGGSGANPYSRPDEGRYAGKLHMTPTVPTASKSAREKRSNGDGHQFQRTTEKSINSNSNNPARPDSPIADMIEEADRLLNRELGELEAIDPEAEYLWKKNEFDLTTTVSRDSSDSPGPAPNGGATRQRVVQVAGVHPDDGSPRAPVVDASESAREKQRNIPPLKRMVSNDNSDSPGPAPNGGATRQRVAQAPEWHQGDGPFDPHPPIAELDDSYAVDLFALSYPEWSHIVTSEVSLQESTVDLPSSRDQWDETLKKWRHNQGQRLIKAMKLNCIGFQSGYGGYDPWELDVFLDLFCPPDIINTQHDFAAHHRWTNEIIQQINLGPDPSPEALDIHTQLFPSFGGMNQVTKWERRLSTASDLRLGLDESPLNRFVRAEYDLDRELPDAAATSIGDFCGVMPNASPPHSSPQVETTFRGKHRHGGRLWRDRRRNITLRRPEIKEKEMRERSNRRKHRRRSRRSRPSQRLNRTKSLSIPWMGALCRDRQKGETRRLAAKKDLRQRTKNIGDNEKKERALHHMLKGVPA